MSKEVLKHVAIMLGIAVVAIWLYFMFLKSYTNNGQKIEVISVENFAFQQAADALNAIDLEAIIADSVYVDGKSGGLVIDQNPKEGSNVKEGRKIYLTVSAYNIPQVKLPVKNGHSLKLATSLLNNCGLKLGDIEQRPDVNVRKGNYVLESKSGGKIVQFGDLLPKGSVINLVVAISSIDSEIYIPNLVGLSFMEAKLMATNGLLNIDKILATDKIKDTLNAYVVKQRPVYSETEKVNAGTNIDVWLSSSKPVNQ